MLLSVGSKDGTIELRVYAKPHFSKGEFKKYLDIELAKLAKGMQSLHNAHLKEEAE